MAGLGRKVFTAGDVLTASDVQNYLMDQSVMVFAGTAARSSAIATPTDGMVTYNQTNNSLEAYNGTDWINKSGLQLVKKQTVGTAVSSVTVTSCFSAAYDNYKIIYSGGVGSGTFDLLMQLTGITGSVYYTAAIYSAYNGTSAVALNSGAVTTLQRIGAANANAAQIELDLQSPFLSKVKIGTSRFQIPASDGLAGTGNQWVNSTTSSTGFTITTTSGTLTGGTIYVYGYGT